MRKRRRFTAEQKVRILREHYENQVRISDLSEQYGINPNVLNRWKKELFENAVNAFSSKHKNKDNANHKEIQLKNKIKQMQEVVTELTTDNLRLRKKYFGEI